MVANEPRDRVGILVPPPLYPLAALGASWALERWAPLPDVPLAGRVAGLLVAVAAVALALWAAATLLRHRTPVDPYRATKALVDQGPYARTRNPIYLALVLGAVGIGLAAGWLWAVPLSLFAGVLLHVVVVLREERYLASKFGEAYASYRSRVRRWV